MSKFMARSKLFQAFRHPRRKLLLSVRCFANTTKFGKHAFTSVFETGALSIENDTIVNVLQITEMHETLRH